MQLGLLEEQKVCDALKQRYAVAVAEQRHCYSLLKAFQVSSVIVMTQQLDVILIDFKIYKKNFFCLFGSLSLSLSTVSTS